MMYRCTRRQPYPPGTPGHTNVYCRQGHYFETENEEKAKEKMKKKFPHDVEPFDIQKWEKD